ncbi:hypothetical protein [Marinospirillum perlucidum]|uniref:hypothetical protein n=1 Tax=Marinospirillum perlucidum TaxID=1982602 RepID=UPI000DF39349|nr:hypothetical protein [Marinospirillum perlucidum]
MRTLSTWQTALAFIPLSLLLGWIFQQHDERYLVSGLFFAGALFFYLFLACRWFRFSPFTLVLLYALTLLSAYVGWAQEKNAVVLAILVSWAVLHFGPKQLTAPGVAYEANRKKQRHPFRVIAVVVAGLLILGMTAGWLDARLREWTLSARYAEKGCSQVEVLREALICQDAEGETQWIDAFYDFKGRHIHFRIWGIDQDRGLMGSVDYTSGRLSHRSQVDFVIEEGWVYTRRNGYQVYFDEEGKPDLTRGTWVFEDDQWMGTEKVTEQHLKALRFE